MHITEVTQPMPVFKARVRIQSVSVTTTVSAESSSQARLLLQYLYGADNVISISANSK